MIKILFLLISMLSMLFALEYEEDRAGPYIGLGYGQTTFVDDGYLKEDTEKSNVTRFYGGAYFNENFSVELDYVKLGTFEAKNVADEDVSEIFTAVTVSTLAHYPLFNDSVDTFLKFGAANLMWRESGTAQENDTNSIALVYGAGLAYRFNYDYSIKIAYDYYDFEFIDTSHTIYTMGIHYVYSAIEVQF